MARPKPRPLKSRAAAHLAIAGHGTDTFTPLASLTGYGGGTSSSGTGYTAADQSSMRGYVYFPNLNPKTALTGYARTEIMRKARWLEANMGLGRHFARTLPRLIGPLIPQPDTSDNKFNELALAHFLRTQSSALIHDQAAAEDFFERQRTVTGRALVDGDCLLAKTLTTSGHARTALYEAPQIGSTYQLKAQGWNDGVQQDRYNRRTAYMVTDPGDFLGKSGTSLAVKDVLHIGLFESPHAPRGLSAFVHAVNRMLDVREIDNDTIRGIKAANLVGFYIANQLVDNIAQAPAAEKFRTKPYFGTAPSTGTDSADIKYEEITQGGGAITRLRQGDELKTVHDERRHPNQAAVIQHFINDCSWGLGMPPEAMWSIAGISGPAVRFIMRMAEKTLNEHRARLTKQFCQPYWAYAIALAQKNGDIPFCKDPDWWKCRWIAPAALTIDVGRDSAAGLRELEAGALTRRDWYGEEGQDWSAELEQCAKERARAQALEKTYGLPPGTLLGERDLQPVAPSVAPPPAKK
jgi:capsid protein